MMLLSTFTSRVALAQAWLSGESVDPPDKPEEVGWGVALVLRFSLGKGKSLLFSSEADRKR